MEHNATRRTRQQIERAEAVYERHGRIFRTAWIAAGVLVVAAGVAMIVFPGPVTVVVPAGFAMLSAVFGWARRALLASVETSVDAKERVEDASTKAKVLGGVAIVCLAGAAVAVAVAIWL